MASYLGGGYAKIPLYPSKSYLNGYSRKFCVEKSGNNGYNALATESEIRDNGDEAYRSAYTYAVKGSAVYYFVRLKQKITIYYQLKQIKDDEYGWSFYFGYVGYQLRLPEKATYGIYSYWTAHKRTDFEGGAITNSSFQPHASCSGPCGGLFTTSGNTNYNSLSGLDYTGTAISLSCDCYNFDTDGSGSSRTTWLYRNPNYSNSNYTLKYYSKYILFGDYFDTSWGGSSTGGCYNYSGHAAVYYGFNRNCIVSTCYNRNGRGECYTCSSWDGVDGTTSTVSQNTIVFNSSPIYSSSVNYYPTRYYRREYTSHYEWRYPTGTFAYQEKVIEYPVRADRGSDDATKSFTISFNL